MKRADKVIITCAVTGSVHTPTMSEYLPITPEQIAAESVAAAEAGASIIHLHARDPETGSPTADLSCLSGPDLVNGLAHLGPDVEAVEHMDSATGLLGDDFQVRMPHVRTDESQLLTALRAKPAKEAQQRLHSTCSTHPQQPSTTLVELGYKRQKLPSPLPCNLVDTDRRYRAQLLMGTTPLNRHLHRTKHFPPARVEDLGNLFPRQPPWPSSQKPSVGVSELVFARRPRHPLDLYPTARTCHPAHCVDQEHRDPPQRHEFESPRRQSVVPRGRTPAPRTLRSGVCSRSYLHFQRQLRALDQARRSVHKRTLSLNPIQDSLDLHAVPLLRADVVSQLHLLRVRNGVLFYHLSSLNRVSLPTNSAEEPKLLSCSTRIHEGALSGDFDPFDRARGDGIPFASTSCRSTGTGGTTYTVLLICAFVN